MNYLRLIGGTTLMLALVPHQAGAADDRGGVAGPFSTLNLPSSLRAVENEAFSRNYEGTRCFNLETRARKTNLGIVCESSSKDFLKDMGVLVSRDPARTDDAPLDNAVIATPTAQYKLAALPGYDAKTAKVDCDTGAEAVYRPTATCQVYVGQSERKSYLYGSFVIEDHAARAKGLAVKTTRDIWKQVEKASR